MNVLKDRTVNLAAYALVTAGVCVAQAKGWTLLGQVCRPLMMLVLSSWFFFLSRRVGDRFTLLVQGGLFCALIGDVALLFKGVDEFNFLVGLGAYCLSLLCYAMAFAHNISEEEGLEGLLVSTVVAFVFAVYAFFFAWDIVPLLDDGLSPAVIAYVSGLALVGVMAAFRYRRTYPRSFWTVLSGALMLLAAGSVQLTDRFRYPFKEAEVVFTVLYAAGHLLIAWGCLLHVLDPDHLRRRQALTT